MTISASKFRADFIEFADVSRFPDSVIDFWMNAAIQFLNTDRWGAPADAGKPNTLYDIGSELITAHFVTLERKAMDEAANNAPPGTSTGPIASKSVDKVSISYDVAGSFEEGGGHWNDTIYGKRFIRLSNMMGAGGLQVGVGFDPLGDLGSGGAWAGPWSANFPNPSG